MLLFFHCFLHISLCAGVSSCICKKYKLFDVYNIYMYTLHICKINKVSNKCYVHIYTHANKYLCIEDGNFFQPVSLLGYCSG